jgi:hypothetical protein
VTDALMKLLGVDERDQCAQRTVDWFRVGRRDNPPFGERPEFRHEIRKDLTDRLPAAPTDDIVETLVNALAGAERDLLMAPLPGPRFVISGKLVEAYALGG